MQRTNIIALSSLFAVIALTPQLSEAQGKGKGAGNDKAKPVAVAKGADKAEHGRGKGQEQAIPQPARASDKAKGQAIAGGVRGVERRSDRANEVAAGPNPTTKAARRVEFLSAREVKRYNRDLRNDQVRPDLRRFTGSTRASEYLAGGALAYAIARGASPTAFLLTPGSDIVEMKNRRGNVLFSLKDDDARKLGAWRVAPLSGETGEGAPSFCRSGVGHPVWGRQWCIDKGFGLASEGNVHWGRTINPSDVRWNGDFGTESLTRDALLSLLGPTTFNRLALHAVTLGLIDPLAATWRTDTSGQRVLLVSSGAAPVAEIADYNNDRLADLMLVALRGW